MTYASFWKRTAAYLVDMCLMYAVIMIVCFMLYFGLGKSFLSIMSGWVGIAVSFGIWILYYAWPESSSWQATIGKKIFGLRVTDLNGQRISFWRSVGRLLGFYVSTFILYIGFLMCFWTEQKQCLHDKMAGCLVVDDKPNEKQGCMIAVLVGLLVVPFVLGVLAAIALPQYIRAVERFSANSAATTLQTIRTKQHAYYDEHGHYAINWGELGLKDLCEKEDGPRCIISNAFTFELEREGVAAQRENPTFSYRLFRAYDLNDTRRDLVCISKEERVKAFCQRFVESQAASRSQAKR